MTKTPTVERYGIALRQRGRAWTPEGTTITVEGRAGRTAEVLSVSVTWYWDVQINEWMMDAPDVEQADQRKDGTLGLPYRRRFYQDGSDANFTELARATRPTFRPVFEEDRA